MKESQLEGPVTNLKEAELLITTNSAINMEKLIIELIRQQDSWSDIFEIENDITNILQQFYFNLKTIGDDGLKLRIACDCVFFNAFHDYLIPLIYQTYEEDDLYFFSKSIELCNLNVTAEQVGAPEKYAVPLLAAIVELSSLDRYKSPLEKIECLCTTHDLIYAELKSALINIISQCSATENEIPIINNYEILPILAMVIIRSKLLHLFSNIYYIEAFLGRLIENDNIRYVLRSFKDAIELLNTITQKSLQPPCDKVCREMDLIKIINVTSKISNKKCKDLLLSPLDGQLLRITDLIVASTNENHPVG